jgi:WD40-like Beta Propeller Repeat
MAVAALAFAASASGRGPAADWRTVKTAHFRVHYTAPAQAWARHAASLLEAIRARVVAEVGYDPPQVVDVLVADPVAEPNGMALPLLDSPRIVLWTSPPGPASVIGTYDDWTELLVLHEDTHLVHMLRRSRNPVQRLLEHVLPLGPITLKAPRWVLEGYATMVEGALTASGRPNSDLRAAILRQRARAGKLPTYAELSSDSRSWLGTSMAYLAGSAYLEWLSQRAGPASLRHLWARMTARTDRSFDAAFEGVFGEGPAALYDRFTAELTWRAVEAERLLTPVEREGERWQELTWTTGEPVVSPDGSQLAIVLRDRDRPPRLVVWSTGPNAEAERRWRERVKEQLAHDAADIAPVRLKPLRREPLHELITTDGAAPFTPRFLPGGKAILFVRFEPDGEGILHPDLFRWTPAAGRVERLTRQADVREADPFPDGGSAVAVRYRNGLSQLVRVDLASGAVAAITAPSLEAVCAQPRVSPDGSRIAYVRHQGGRWRLVVRELASGAERVLPVPDDGTVAYPAWDESGRTVYASIGREGFIDVQAMAADGSGRPQPVTRTVGAALAPAPAGRTLYFLGLQADGLDLRTVDLREAPPALPPTITPGLAPAVRPAPAPPPAPFAAAPVAPGRPYGLGRQELDVVVGGNLAPSARGWEFGARLGDVVGRLDALAIAATGDGASPRGAALAVAWRGLPATLSLQLFDSTEKPSRQPREVPGLGTRLDQRRNGAEVRTEWGHRWLAGGLQVAGGVLLSRVHPAGGSSLSRRIVFASAHVSHQPSRGAWRFPSSVDVRFDAGRTGDQPWRRYGGTVSAGALRKDTGITLLWRRDVAHDATLDLDRLQLGGVASTILPGSALDGRILVPALPAGTRIGDEHEEQRVTVGLGGVPLFYERHLVWDRGGGRGSWLRLAGVAWDATGGPVPLVGVPGFHLTVGVARILDPPFKDVTQAWLALAWHP